MRLLAEIYYFIYTYPQVTKIQTNTSLLYCSVDKFKSILKPESKLVFSTELLVGDGYAGFIKEWKNGYALVLLHCSLFIGTKCYLTGTLLMRINFCDLSQSIFSHNSPMQQF